MSFSLLGFSAYISEFENQKAFLEPFSHQNRLIFTSLHMPEELSDSYVERVTQMTQWLTSKGFRVIGDISKRTLGTFQCQSILELANKLQLSMLRIDYGFSLDEMLEAAASYPLAFNASTVSIEDALKIQAVSDEVIAIHNFYPREYTALSLRQFNEMNRNLTDHGIQVMAFIPNLKNSRGPIYAGLPTLEHHRYQSTYLSYLELAQDPNISGILLSDLGADQKDLERIQSYEMDKRITIPVQFEAPYKHLERTTYTIRIDSPDCLLRLRESREFATPGEVISPFNCISRSKGSITCDNAHYGRYSGEIQILKESLPLDYRVNVIGMIPQDHQSIVDFIPNGCKIYFDPVY